MKILILNPPYSSIGSRLAGEHLPPLGLLAIGGPLIDAGYDVALLDAEWGPLGYDEIISQVLAHNPDILLLGHSGSTSAQPVINEIARLLRHKTQDICLITGGVFPTYHWFEILSSNPSIDYIVLGEGEDTVLKLIVALEKKEPIHTLRGVAYRLEGQPQRTAAAELIQNLDDYRIGWELMQGYNYTYWGKKKAVVIQFSRGCPYPCTYCGQSLFWGKWRHRDPQLLADEIEMLHHTYGIEVINFADENPSSNQRPWLAFLEALCQKNLPLILVGSIRADNIVRDAEYLPLYKKAGFERFLLGMENYDKDVLEKIKKSGTIAQDREAIRLLRKNDILSMATYVVGFYEEKTRDFYNSMRHLLSYDPDQIQLLYITPHRWTPYYEEVKDRKIIQEDQRKWDYKHQVLATRMNPWLVILYVKVIEVILQTRPKALKRLFFHRDRRLRKAMWWYSAIGKRVWIYELYEFIFRTKHSKKGEMTVKEFWS